MNKEEQRESINKKIEEELNKRALKIGRKVLDELCLHRENKATVKIRKSDHFDWYVVKVGRHYATGLFDNQIEFIKREGLREKGLNDFEIKEKTDE